MPWPVPLPDYLHLSVRQCATWALGKIGSAAIAALPAPNKVAADPDTRLARLAKEAIKQIGG